MSPDQNDNPQQPQQEPPRRPGGPQGKGPRKSKPSMSGWILIFMLGTLLLMLFKDVGSSTTTIDFSEFLKQVDNGGVEKVTIGETTITGTLKPEALEGQPADTSPEFTTDILPGLRHEKLVERLEKYGVKFKYKQDSGLYHIFLGIIPWIILFLIMYLLVFRQFRGAGGAGMLGSFGRSRHRVTSKEQVKVTFANVAGIDEAKEEVDEIIQFLRSPRKFQRLGGRIPRGILLIGEP